MELTFNTDRVTQNTVRFAEETEEGMVPKMGTIYVQKSVLKSFGVTNPNEAKSVTLKITGAS